MKRVALALAVLTCLPATASATDYTASGAAAVVTTVADFRTALGTLNPAGAGTQNTGRREINWDGVPDGSANPLPRDFFNNNSPRGILLSSPSDIFRVSNSTVDVRFADIQASYSASFTTFSPARLFATLGATVMDVDFLVSGSSRPATVSGFGAVFTDVDAATTSFVKAYGQFGEVLGTVYAPTANNDLSFAGMHFPGGERIAAVQVGTGNAALGSADGGAADDKVVLDDFIYGEPGQPRLSINDVTTAEGADGATHDVTFTVTRDIDTQTAFSVPYATLGDGADDGQDFTGKAGTIAFNAGETTREIGVTVKGDKTDEPDEAFRVLLLDDGNATIADGDGRATITDDDPPVVVSPTVTVTPAPTEAPAPTVEDRTAPSIAVRGFPKRRKCARRDFTATLTVTEDSLASLRVRLDKTVLSDRATLSAVRDRIRLRIPARALRRGVHRVRITAVDKAGNRRNRTVPFRRC